LTQFDDADEPNEDVLTQRWFHKLLVLFHRPAEWSTWRVLVAILSLATIVVLVWFPTSGGTRLAVSAGFIYLSFSVFDGLLLWSLPRRGISFGPWQAQTIVLTVPRVVVSVSLALVAVVASGLWGLVGLVVIHCIGSIALIWGALIEPFHLELSYLTIKSDKFRPWSEPVRLLHISDLHVERLTKRERKLLELVEQANPELILITGDYLNLSYVRDKKAQEDVRKLLGQLSAPYGVFAVLGSPPVDERDVVPQLFDDLAVDLLVDQSRFVRMGGDRQLLLLGMDCTHSLPLDSQRLESLVANAPEHIPSILMYHAPDLFPEAVELGIDLYLCGHTHGGQVRMPWFGALLTSSQLGRRFQMGFYQEGKTNMYVSRGVGMEGLSAPRVRFHCPPEITLVTIEGEAQE
jgi:predicted MPP superfamily phosphohydrolase